MLVYGLESASDVTVLAVFSEVLKYIRHSIDKSFCRV